MGTVAGGDPQGNHQERHHLTGPGTGSIRTPSHPHSLPPPAAWHTISPPRACLSRMHRNCARPVLRGPGAAMRPAYPAIPRVCPARQRKIVSAIAAVWMAVVQGRASSARRERAGPRAGSGLVSAAGTPGSGRCPRSRLAVVGHDVVDASRSQGPTCQKSRDVLEGTHGERVEVAGLGLLFPPQLKGHGVVAP